MQPVVPNASPLRSRPIWASIDLHAYTRNLRLLHEFARVPLLCVLKADGYGHGALLLAGALKEIEPGCVSMIGVASIDEGAALRHAGIEKPILLLSAILPEEVPAALEWRLTPTLFTPELAQAVQNEAGKLEREVEVHLKIDTGMNRLGVAWREAAQFYRSLRDFSLLRVAGVYTHFACADCDASFTQRQRRNFLRALDECELPLNGARPLLHAANSAALLNHPDALFDMARAGIASYGLWPSPELRAKRPVDLRAVMSLHARVTHVHSVPRGHSVSYGATWRAPRPSLVATVAAGYADGYPRAASGQAQVLVRGRRVPVVGRVTMDQIMLDVTDLSPDVKPGEVVTLWGRDGEEEISADDVGEWAGTIGYEIVCGVAPRVARVPIEN